ncbi:hypothetical protein V5799_025368 [Amblyomma americanum]|uniref:Uncharacterized protein n=1 Tax=Amblyomma americanum TaxID=6943 RepID=A0AAQ4E9F4_AMBAM
MKHHTQVRGWGPCVGEDAEGTTHAEGGRSVRRSIRKAGAGEGGAVKGCCHKCSVALRSCWSSRVRRADDVH